MLDTLLLVDLNSLFIRAMEVKSDIVLTWQGKPTMGIFGFIQQLSEHINATNPDRIIICSDAKPYDRSTLFTDYKKHHKTAIDKQAIQNYRFNRDKVDELINTLKLPYFKEVGLEADDLIAICCKKYRDDFKRIVIASGDSDLYQLFRFRGIFLRKRVKTKFVLYSRSHFKKDFQDLTIKQFIRYLSIVGTHNAVPGISKFGPVKAMKIVKDEDVYQEFYKEHKKELDLYQQLIRLPFRKATIHISKKISKGVYPGRKVIQVLDSVGIDLTKQMNDAFKKLEVF
jgi:5'-3' exonuclease